MAGAREEDGVFGRLAGVWRLVSVEASDGTGGVGRPYGEAPVGYIVYTAERRMMVSMMRGPAPRVESGDLFAGAGEAFRAGHVYVGYSGAVALEDITLRGDGAAEGTVVHTLDTCSYPNWVGTAQRRRFRLERDRLTLTTPRIERAGEQAVATVVWERVRAE
jgi:hypothetical protein